MNRTLLARLVSSLVLIASCSSNPADEQVGRSREALVKPPVRVAYTPQPTSYVVHVGDCIPTYYLATYDEDGYQVPGSAQISVGGPWLMPSIPNDSTFPMTCLLSKFGGGTTDPTNGIVLSRIAMRAMAPAATAITVSAPTYLSTVYPVTILTNPSAQLEYLWAPSDTGRAQTMAPVTIAIEDANGMPTDATSNVTVALATPNGATLSGTLTVAAVNGRATFSDLAVDKLGTYDLVASSSGLPSVTSASFAITSPITLTCDHNPCSVGSTLTATYGDLPGNPKDWLATALAGDPDTTYFARQYTNGAVSGSVTFPAPPQGGSVVVRAFANDTTQRLGQSNAIAVSPYKLVFIVKPGAVRFLAPMTPAIQVAIEDASGNILTNESTVVTISDVCSYPQKARLYGGLAVQTVNGVATFPDLSIDSEQCGGTLVAKASNPAIASASASPTSISGNTTFHSVGQVLGATGEKVASGLATSGARLAVGAAGANGGAGAVRVYTKSGSSWIQEQEITASDATPSTALGVEVAMSGSTIVATGAGKAYVFVRAGTKWAQQAMLVPSDGATPSLYGQPLAIDADTVLLSGSGSHAAYVFVRSGTTWSQQALLAPGTGDYSVTVHRDELLLGDPAASTAYLYTRAGTTWTKQGTLASSVISNSRYGSAVALDGSGLGARITTPQFAAISAYSGSGPYSAWTYVGVSQPGGVLSNAGNTMVWTYHHLFLDAGDFVLVDSMRLTQTGVTQTDGLGRTLAANDHFVAAGAPYQGNSGPGVYAGAAYFWSDLDGLCALPCDATDECHFAGSCVPATGVCTNPSLPDGAPCSIGTCQAGQCALAQGSSDNDAGIDGSGGGGGDAGDAAIDVAATETGSGSTTDASLDGGASNDDGSTISIDASPTDAGSDDGSTADAGTNADAGAEDAAPSDASPGLDGAVAEAGIDASAPVDGSSADDATTPAKDASGAATDGATSDTGSTADASSSIDAASGEGAGNEVNGGGTSCATSPTPVPSKPMPALVLGGALILLMRRRRERTTRRSS